VHDAESLASIYKEVEYIIIDTFFCYVVYLLTCINSICKYDMSQSMAPMVETYRSVQKYVTSAVKALRIFSKYAMLSLSNIYVVSFLIAYAMFEHHQSILYKAWRVRSFCSRSCEPKYQCQNYLGVLRSQNSADEHLLIRSCFEGQQC
jgi:hypothetical protein